ERVDAAFVDALATRYRAIVGQFAHAPHDVLDASEEAFQNVDQSTTPASSPHEDSSEARALAAIWNALFDTATITPRDDLFAAGATSFAVVRFVDAARKAGFDIAIHDVFATPHCAGLAATRARGLSLSIDQ